jgi:hypothetical protein
MASFITLAAISTILSGTSELGFSLNISRMKFPDDPRIRTAAGDEAADDRFSLGESN